MRIFSTYRNYNSEKAGVIAFIAFVISLIFKGRKKDGKHKNIFIRFVKNFTRVSTAAGLISVLDAKKTIKNKVDGKSFEEVAEIYNKSAGETVIDIEYDENGNVKSTVKSAKTYSDLDEMTSQLWLPLLQKGMKFNA